MLLVIDVGNTNIVLGLYRDSELLRSWRLTSDVARTVDEYAILVHELLDLAELRVADIDDVIISSVVPPLLTTLERLCRDYFKIVPGVVGAGLDGGMPIHYDDPRQVGADRIVNAVAAYAKYRRSLIVIDFGTATTFDFVTAQGEYQGGAIAPGLGISAEALFARASKLPRVELACPPRAIARNTVHSMQAGLLFGYAGLVDGIVRRMQEEGDRDAQVVATGGLATVIAPVSQTITVVEPELTLDGLRIIRQRQRLSNH